MSALKHGLEKALEYFPYLGAGQFLLLCWLHTQELNDHRKGAAKATSKSKTSKNLLPHQSTPRAEGKATPVQGKVL